MRFVRLEIGQIRRSTVVLVGLFVVLAGLQSYHQVTKAPASTSDANSCPENRSCVVVSPKGRSNNFLGIPGISVTSTTSTSTVPARGGGAAGGRGGAAGAGGGGAAGGRSGAAGAGAAGGGGGAGAAGSSPSRR